MHEQRGIYLHTEGKDLFHEINIKGTIKPKWYSSLGYMIEVNGTKFFNPLECHFSFLLGQGDDEWKTCIGDERYMEIEACIVDKVIPKINKEGNKTINSYTLKHALECEIGGYVSNETVKFIMAIHGSPTRKSQEEYDINVMYPYSGSFDLKTNWNRKRKSKYCRGRR